jgi:LmbE family N-acetylglucosaminyl deacetylase
MLTQTIDFSSAQPNILLLGAHCDDIEIGCGATVMRLIKRYPAARFLWVTFCSDDERAAETRQAAARLLAGTSNGNVVVETFRSSYLPYGGPDLKDRFEELKGFDPDLVLTHFRGDLHQDHRVVNELTWNTFRNHSILEYEIPKFDGDISTPNVFVPIDRSELQRKCEILMDCYPSQSSKTWFSPETFMSIARLRGIECNAPEGYAEAFFGRKICLAF